MKNLVNLLLGSFFFLSATSQNLEISFTGVFDQAYIALDSIAIMNLTQDCDTILVYPDTTFSLITVGMIPSGPDPQELAISETSPNPFLDRTRFRLILPEKDRLQLIVYDVTGRTVTKHRSDLPEGKHDFIFQASKQGLYVISASCSSGSQTKKVYCQGTGLQEAKLIRTGVHQYKKSNLNLETDDYFQFAIGDQLLYKGYVNTFTGVLESVLLDSPEISQAYTFQVATNIPCPGTPTVDYEEQTYNTVQIFNQCWMKESLNVGTMIPGGEEMTDDGIIEKYCFNNEPDSCSKYGALYQWQEMMQYTTQQGAQGICPPGWHIPTDEEWKQLCGAADSQYGYPDPEWNDIGHLGFDADSNLKSDTAWNQNNNGSDLVGFHALPGGSLHPDYGFIDVGDYGLFWSSSESYTNEEPWYWSADVFYSGIVHWHYHFLIGFSVRCLEDD